MYTICQAGKEKIISLVEQNGIHEIARTLAMKYEWIKFNIDYIDFYIKVFEEIKLLSKYDIQQKKCLEFYLDLIITLGKNFLEDPNYLWVKNYYSLNSYLPELDLANKLDIFLYSYKNQVLGKDYFFLKEAIKKLVNVDILDIEEIYPEKYIYLSGIGLDFKTQDNNIVDAKIEFVLGYNFKKNTFLNQYIVDGIFDFSALSKVMES